MQYRKQQTKKTHIKNKLTAKKKCAASITWYLAFLRHPIKRAQG